MKKLLIVIGTTMLLSSCSQLDSLLEKMPFAANDEQIKVDENTGEQVDDKPVVEEPKEQGNENEQTNKEVNEHMLEAHFFNEVKEVSGRYIIQNPLNIMSLVNKKYALPDQYTPDDLVRPNVRFSFGDQDVEKSYYRKEAALHLEMMFEQADSEGITLYAISGYRSFDRQVNLFQAQVERAGSVEAAAQVVAMPGYSEHQTGLAMDISSNSVGLALVEEFGDTVEGKWLAENAHKFGFILRYPLGKETITGYQYEPWHFRYVGMKAANSIFEQKLTLEEYFEIVEKI